MERKPPTEWTDRHTEVAEYLAVRGVTYRAIADVFGVHINTVNKHIVDTKGRRIDYHAQLIRNCKRDLDALDIDLNDALAAVLGDADTSG